MGQHKYAVNLKPKEPKALFKLSVKGISLSKMSHWDSRYLSKYTKKYLFENTIWWLIFAQQVCQSYMVNLSLLRCFLNNLVNKIFKKKKEVRLGLLMLVTWIGLVKMCEAPRRPHVSAHVFYFPLFLFMFSTSCCFRSCVLLPSFLFNFQSVARG